MSLSETEMLMYGETVPLLVERSSCATLLVVPKMSVISTVNFTKAESWWGKPSIEIPSANDIKGVREKVSLREPE